MTSPLAPPTHGTPSLSRALFKPFHSNFSALSYDSDDITHGPTHPQNPSEEGENPEGVGVQYKSGLDLNRFQKLVEETAPPSAPSLIGRAPQHQMQETHDQQSGQYRSVAESIQSDAGSNESVAGVSEFSSIPGDGGRGGNSTVDSDVSSVYNSYKTAENAQRGMQSQHAALPLRVLQHGAVSQREASQQGVSSIQQQGLPSQHITLSEHPLHVSRKMPSQQTSRPLPAGDGRGRVVTARTSSHTEKIHADLTNLGEASKILASTHMGEGEYIPYSLWIKAKCLALAATR